MFQPEQVNSYISRIHILCIEEIDYFGTTL